MPRGQAKPLRDLADLTRVVQRSEGFPEVLAALKNGHAATVDGAWGSAAPLAAIGLGMHAPTTLLVVIAHVGDLDDFAQDLASFSGTHPDILPAWDRISFSKATPTADEGEAQIPALLATDEVHGQRLRVLKRLSGSLPPRVVLAPFQAMMQPVPKVDALRASSRVVRVGDTLAVEDLAGWLLDQRLVRVEVVEVAGEFSLRGGILDVFPPDANEPVRLEFFGDEVESIRPFNPETQRSEDRWDNVTLSVVPLLDPAIPEQLGHVADYLPNGAWVALVEPADLKEQGRQYLSRISDPRGLFGVDATMARLVKRPTIAMSTVTAATMETTCRLRVESIERFSGDLAKVKEELESAAAGENVMIACHNAAEAERLGEVFSDTAMSREGRLSLTVGRLRSGFHAIDAHTLVLSDHELFDRTEVPRPSIRRRYEGRAIDSFLDLNEGDLVVHLHHGIAYYRGLQLVDRGMEHGEEQLVLEFAGQTKLYVPIAQIDLVQKYVGGGRGTPALSKIGSNAWERRKKRVAEAVVDLASELLEIQAKRASQPGFAYPEINTHWQQEFEAAFPYQETPDQITAIDSIRADMAIQQPMDRLLCGDVGYGKTEVAMRAAFRAVESGKQVAVLVPTTVLAEQHYRTFSARMAEFPFTIEAIHRFRTRGEIRQTLEKATQGSVDILIGTHRLVQKDVEFKNLGLVIIDEEQRFGVEDKEWLKHLRALVDVLTLSATPIPRTLHMSLLGIRDISNLETPPPDRKSIETRICRWDDETIRRAIHREMNRDGQVFFVHNRIHDIQSIADKIQQLVPAARILIGHGQMAGDELEAAMLAFVRKEADILVSTTIIESGLDIPNVNTIFIHEADRYGLADLHQLRGRVGRYKHRAYAYLLLEEEKALTPGAVKRLKAIEEFTDLGAGFKIALRDLEIRGAGNILGAEQSGHIEAVGYELYCSLLESAVRTLKNEAGPKAFDASIELGWRAYLPRDYVPGPKLKVELYRRLSRLRGLEQLEEFRKELIDRFGGPLPAPAENLLVEAQLRILAGRWQLAKIHVEDEYAVLTYRNRRLVEGLARRLPKLVRVVDKQTAYVPLGEKRPKGAVVAAVLREVLTGNTKPPKATTRAAGTDETRTGRDKPGKPSKPTRSAKRPEPSSTPMYTMSRQAVEPASSEPGEPTPGGKAAATVGLGNRLKRRKDCADLNDYADEANE